MTISHSSPIRYFSSAIKYLVIAIIMCALALIFLYNRMVTARAVVKETSKKLELLTTENAKLKNELFTLIDTRALTMNVQRLGYIKDSNPTYLTFLADGSVREGTKVSVR